MAEAALNAMAQQLVDLTLCKTRYDAWDLQWYTEAGSKRVQVKGGMLLLAAHPWKTPTGKAVRKIWFEYFWGRRS